jgi:hypothetical protein
MMRKAETKVIANVRVGRPDVEPWAPSHVRGVFQGNKLYLLERAKGLDEERPTFAKGSARRSTGIRAKSHEVIDPRMPKLSPS